MEEMTPRRQNPSLRVNSRKEDWSKSPPAMADRGEAAEKNAKQIIRTKCFSARPSAARWDVPYPPGSPLPCLDNYTTKLCPLNHPQIMNDAIPEAKAV